MVGQPKKLESCSFPCPPAKRITLAEGLTEGIKMNFCSIPGLVSKVINPDFETSVGADLFVGVVWQDPMNTNNKEKRSVINFIMIPPLIDLT